MVWPATDWHLIDGKVMVVNRAGTVYAVKDADECCCCDECPDLWYCLTQYPDVLFLTILTGARAGNTYAVPRVAGACIWRAPAVPLIGIIDLNCINVVPSCGGGQAWRLAFGPVCRLYKCDDRCTPLGIYTNYQPGPPPTCPWTAVVHT